MWYGAVRKSRDELGTHRFGCASSPKGLPSAKIHFWQLRPEVGKAGKKRQLPTATIGNLFMYVDPEYDWLHSEPRFKC